MNRFKDTFSSTKFLKGFTLVELIIVITILAILSVSAFLVVSQWIGKSRDSRRLADIGTIQRALEVSLTENAKYPTPDSAVNIAAGSIIIGQQGKFGDGARSATDIKTTPMDPLDNVAYTYYVATGGKNYQVMGFLENSSTLTFRGIESQGPRSTVSDQENLQFSNSACTCNSNGTNSICSVAFFAFCLNYAHASEVSAADYSVRIPTVKGETLGILILSGTNQPIEELGSTVDLSTSTSSLIAVFSDTDKSIGTGGQVLTPISIKNTAAANQTGVVALDPTLVAYWDMESRTSTGLLLDFSKYTNNGTPSGGVSIGSANGVKSKGTMFDGTDDMFTVLDNSSLDFSSTQDITISTLINSQDLSGSRDFIIEKGYDDVSQGRVGFWMETWSANGGLRGGNGNWNVGGTGATLLSDSNDRNKFVHFVMIIDNNNKTLKMYNNGVLTKQIAMPNLALTNTVNLAIGCEFGGGPTCGGLTYFKGIIDDVRIYGRALSDSEVRALYKSLN